ncbi:hypothetical protein B0H17DRAFT_1108969 [Mycena rosella]|uniref:Flavin-containing monooxygenase n=1 Tax=Mycena rosella TaxID=1033263 RepID=A0AAD7FQ39_MYCRO|nr:hypothetical protein B0H17DRAFT_1108969 [Mycena rosella]
MQDIEYISNARPKRILIIGGGASGLVTLRNLRERGNFDEVQLVERRDDVGGVWYLDDETGEAPRWPSPAYPGLIGNVLPEFLSFSAFPPFPEPPSTATGQPFPSLAETHAYLRAFAAPHLSSGAIRLNTEVQVVEELPARAGWRVRMQRYSAAEPEALEEMWDAVVIAVACYDHPVFPPTPGLARLRELGRAHHAQGWRGPAGYERKRVLVIGNANSGNDIAAQLAPVAGAVYQSVRRPNFPGFPSLPDARVARVAPVAEYTVDTSAHTIDARLADGRTLHGLDAVLFGTGYHPFPDFVRVLAGGRDAPTLEPLVSHDTAPPRVPHLHRYTLYARNPALAFIGTAFASYTPFPLADVCSAWLALAWAGEIAYPTTLPRLLEFEAERLAAVGAARREMEVAAAGAGEPGTDEGTGQGKTEASALVAYGVLGPFEEAYASALRADVVQARPELDAVLPVWSAERTAAREAMFGAKRAALELAREREGGRE